MTHVGDIVPYYIRHRDIDLFNGHTVGLSIIHAVLSLVTCLVLLALAFLTIRARPNQPGWLKIGSCLFFCLLNQQSDGYMVQYLSFRRKPRIHRTIAVL